jgi:hypothetical protein
MQLLVEDCREGHDSCLPTAVCRRMAMTCSRPRGPYRSYTRAVLCYVHGYVCYHSVQWWRVQPTGFHGWV